MTNIFGTYRLLGKQDSYVLKGVCMLLIILHHLDNALPAWDSHIPLNSINGLLGTGVFLFLSGYGLSASNKDSGRRTVQYYWTKVVQMFLPYLFYWVVAIVCFALFAPERITGDWLLRILCLKMAQGESWFFETILLLYAITFVVFAQTKSMHRRLCTISLLCIVLFAYRYLMGFEEWWWNTLLCFPLGILVFTFYPFFSRHSCWAWPIAIACLGVALKLQSHTLSAISFSFVCIYSLCFVRINCKPLLLIGKYSLAFYFLQDSALIGAKYIVGKEPPYPYIVCTFLLLALLVTLFAWMNRHIGHHQAR